MADTSGVPGAHRAVLWIIFLFLVMMVVVAEPTACAQEQLPVAKIVSVDAPQRVSPGESFKVVVVVEYSDRYSTDIAILDKVTGFVLASKGLIIPAGRNLFTFSLTGRELPGNWTLLATVRIWWHDGWYGGQDEWIVPFQVAVSDVVMGIFSVKSSLASSVIKIDGIPHSISTNGLELSIRRGLHTIEAESTMAIGDGTRAVFDHWNDGVRSPIRTIYLEDRIDLSTVYSIEFLLTVESSVSETTGSGWYPAGMNATFLAFNPFNSDVRYKFSHWSGDFDSTSSVGRVVMDRPKRVVANWSQGTQQTATAYQLLLIPLVFTFCSALLIAVAFALRRRARAMSLGHVLKKDTLRALALVAISVTASAHWTVVQPASALTLIQPESVTIGDALWYHWNQAASDTLLIWLGGGVVEQFALSVNPYEFESYNTIHFIQDLARYYDVLALKKGSTRSVDPTLNRTMFREPYLGSNPNNFMEKIRGWANGYGYTYLYVVGYSVGAMVGAEELVLANPTQWTSPNGFIVITTKIPQAASLKASALRASLLLLYGSKVAPEFTASGESFFQRAPQEGWVDTFWYHKEFDVIPDVEHEVWTILDSGEYDNRALLLTIRFIETTKGLQFEQVKPSIEKAALNLTTKTQAYSPYNVEITSVTSPSKVRTEEAFRVDSVVRYDLPSTHTVAVAAYDSDEESIASAAQEALAGTGQASFVTTILSGATSRMSHLLLIPLVYTENGWTVKEEEIKAVTVQVRSGYTLTVITAYPGIVVNFDGQDFQTGADGHLALNATPGYHLISVEPIVIMNNSSRLIFQQWNGTLGSSHLRVAVSGDMALFAIYRRQYHLDVSSPLGQATGTGWYDENSSALFYVTPTVVIDNVTNVFARWSGDSNDSSPSSILFINGSKEVHASWRELNSVQSNPSLTQFQVLLALSSMMLLASVIFVVVSTRRNHRTLRSLK